MIWDELSGSSGLAYSFLCTLDPRVNYANMHIAELTFPYNPRVDVVN